MKLTCKRAFVLLFLAVSCIVTLVGRLLFDQMLNSMMVSQIQKHMALRNGTKGYDDWVTPPAPVQFRIFVFDLVNPMEVQEKGVTPVFMEKGPYVYKMHMKKTDIHFHENYTVQFRQPEMFVYDRESSVGPETETFTNLNMFFFIIANQLKGQSPAVQTAVDELFQVQGDDAFMTRSVKEIWWGYEDPVLKRLSDLLKRLHINATVPDRFGFYMGRNNTDGGVYNIFSGQSGNFDNFEFVDRYNGERKLSIWNSDYANRIAGTDGSAQPMPLQKHTNFSIFDGNMLRSLNLVYDHATQVRGVDAYRFKIPFSDFASAEDNPNNAGFCTPNIRHCLPSGGINLSVSSQGVPMVLSLPHFVGGDPYYQRQVRGLRPSPEKHQPFFDYHVLTGVNLRAARRYQIVMHIKPMEHFPAFSNFPEVFLPIIWIDGTSIIDNATLTLFKTKMQDVMDNMVYVKAAMVVIVCLTALISFALIIYWTRKDRKNLKGNRVESADDGDDRLLDADPTNDINTVYDDYRHHQAFHT